MVVIGRRIVGQPHKQMAYRSPTFLGLSCLVIGILLSSCGCDSQEPHYDSSSEFADNYDDPYPRAGPILPTYASVLFEHGNYRFRLRPDGVLENARWNSVPNVADSTLSIISSAGLWMSGLQQNRVRANIAWFSSNFIPTKLTLEEYSMYHFRASDVPGDIGNWPDSLGAPVLESNLPAVWGDIVAMAPSVTGSDPERPIRASGFDQVNVVQTVFGIDHYRLADVFFIRYDISNRSEDRLEEFHLGIFTDIDLDSGSFIRGSSICNNVIDYNLNRTGFDFDRKLSYTYSMPEGVDVDEPCLGVVTGYLILETSTDEGLAIQPGSHRILREHRYLQQGFNEAAFDRVKQIHQAMKGLSVHGRPMINPVTGEATKWAFTGNPVDSTGWIDYPADVRSLLSTEAFTLDSGEHTAMTVAWITVRDESLALALDEMRVLADILIDNPGLWRDPR